MLRTELGIRWALVRLRAGVGFSYPGLFLPLPADTMEVVLVLLFGLLAPTVLASGKSAPGPAASRTAAWPFGGGGSWLFGTLRALSLRV